MTCGRSKNRIAQQIIISIDGKTVTMCAYFDTSSTALSRIHEFDFPFADNVGLLGTEGGASELSRKETEGDPTASEDDVKLMKEAGEST